MSLSKFIWLYSVSLISALTLGMLTMGAIAHHWTFGLVGVTLIPLFGAILYDIWRDE